MWVVDRCVVVVFGVVGGPSGSGLSVFGLAACVVPVTGSESGIRVLTGRMGLVLASVLAITVSVLVVRSVMAAISREPGSKTSIFVINNGRKRNIVGSMSS